MIFKEHSDRHILDAIQKSHPEWQTKDGSCEPCLEYYRRQLSGELPEENINDKGRVKRSVAGVVMFILAVMYAVISHSSAWPVVWRLGAFFPLLAAFLGFFQARSRTCVVLSEMGMKEGDCGRHKVSDEQMACKLKQKGRRIVLQAVIAAALVTALFYFLP